MMPIKSLFAVLAAAVAVGACHYSPTSESKEDLLASSGFRIITVKTPQQVASFKGLPAHQLSRAQYKGKPVWVYPDRDICGCVYLGNQTAYNTYIKKASQKMIETATKANFADDPYNPTASINELDWDMSPWGDDPQAYGMYYN